MLRRNGLKISYLQLIRKNLIFYSAERQKYKSDISYIRLFSNYSIVYFYYFLSSKFIQIYYFHINHLSTIMGICTSEHQRLIQKGKQGRLQTSEKVQVLHSEDKEIQNVLEMLSDQQIYQLLNRVPLIKKINQKFKEKVFTDYQFGQIAQVIVDELINIQNNETLEQKKQMSKIFNPQICKEVKDGISLQFFQKLYFEDIKKIWMEWNVGKKIKPAIQSRIYHTIANIKHQDSIKERLYDYNFLAEKQLDDIVKLQHIAYHAEHLSQRFMFKLQSIEQQHRNITDLLLNCFSDNYCKDLKTFKYDLSQTQSLKAAEISRKACQYHEYGIVIILIYFVRSYKKMEKLGYDFIEIEKQMKLMIQKITAKYPPGEKYEGNLEEFNKQMEKLELKGASFENPKQMLTFKKGDNKREVLKKFIIEQARIAYKNKGDFQHLIRSTCLTKSIAYKAGLKLYPGNINNKAMMRIQEKMFFKGNKQVERRYKSTIKETLKLEDEVYQECVEKELQELKEVKFSISDMVRAKCTFVNMEDIIDTVYKIKSFVDTENAKQKDRYRLIEIESRFNKKTPISDITLKVVLNQQIVSELQLTLQTNISAYNFAHKIYEINRSKLLSTIKIVDNYYEEDRMDFARLIQRRLNITERDKQYQELQNLSKNAKDFFELGQMDENIDFQILNIWKKVFDKKVKQNKNPIHANLYCFRPHVQLLITTIFESKIGEDKSVTIPQITKYFTTKKANNKQSDDMTPWIYESVIMFYNLKDIYYKTRNVGTKKEDYEFRYQEIYELKNKKKSENSNLMSIDSYSKKSFRIFEQLQFNVSFQDNLFDYVKKPYMIYGQESLTYVQLLKEAAYLKGINRHEQNDKQKYLLKALKIMQKIKKGNNNDEEILKIALLIIQNYHEKNANRQAREWSQQWIEKIKNLCVQKQQNTKIVQCELLLAECLIKDKKSEQFEKQYNLTLQTCKNLNVPMVGQIISNSELRIAKQIWKQSLLISENDKDIQQQNMRYNLDVHFRLALSQLASYLSFSYLVQQKVRLFISQFKSKKINELKIKENKYKIAQIQNIKYQEGQYELLNMVKWPKLKKLELKCQECKYLSMAKFPNLESLSLSENNIGDKGCQYLVLAKFPFLKDLNLDKNNIGKEGCLLLSTSIWRHLQFLSIDENNLGQKGCEQLIKAKWPFLHSLKICNNSVGEEGCLYLSRSHWPKLQVLNIECNQIEEGGCKYLVEANWPELRSLFLWKNNIEEKGCEYLSKSNWPKLQSLNLQENNIEHDGCYSLIEANWPNLIELNLQINRIQNLGCQHLAQKQWPKLQFLHLWNNNITEKGQFYLHALKEQKFQSLRYLNFNDKKIEDDKYNVNSKVKAKASDIKRIIESLKIF